MTQLSDIHAKGQLNIKYSPRCRSKYATENE